MKVLQTHGKLTKGPADARNVDGWSPGCTESLWKFLWLHGKLTDFDRRSHWCTESWWIVPRMHRRLTEVDGMSIRMLDLPSTFCASKRLRSIFHVSAESSFTFHQLPSTSRAPAGASIINLHCRRTFRHHQSTFRASAGLNVNLRQLFVRPGNLLPTFHMSGWPSVNIPCVCRTCQLCSTSLNYSVVQAVQQRFLSRTHEIFSYDPCYFHYSVVLAVWLSWTSLD